MRALVYAVLLTVALVMLFPFAYMLLTAVKTDAQLARPDLLPAGAWHWENFATAWGRAPFARQFLNSATVAVTTAALTALLAAMAGFAFAKHRFRGRGALFAGTLATLMVPPQVTMIPNFLTCSRIGLLDSWLGLIVPVLPLGFGIFLMRQFIRGVPDDLLAAARIDGASELRTFFQLVLPLCRPALLTLAIFTFMGSWNSFLWPLIILDTPENYTVPIGLTRFSQQFNVEQNHLMAISLLSLLPGLALFLIFQRAFVRGMTGGALSDEG
ncbi:MAG: carbohydrate ABC transporter permease [Candidatus Sumerlaeia bacterium]|nr:carbohydrate ABC transporter permease [Candidatus Sumerlaeia bacterium]